MKRAVFVVLTLLLVAASVEGVLRIAARQLLYSVPDTSGEGFVVVCIGDSHTYGLGADDGESYPDQLGQLLAERGHSNVRVVNLGMPGLTLPLIKERLSEYLRAHSADVVIVSGGINDANRRDRFLWGISHGVSRNDGVLDSFVSVRLAKKMWRELVDADVPPPRSRETEKMAGHLRDAILGGDRSDFGAVLKIRDPTDREYFYQLTYFLDRRDYGGAREVFSRLLGAPARWGVVQRFALPSEYYVWELAMLTGDDDIEPLPAVRGRGAENQHAYQVFTRAHDAFKSRDYAKAAQLFAKAKAGTESQAFADYISLWEVWLMLRTGDADSAWAKVRRLLTETVNGDPDVLEYQVLAAAFAWLKLEPANELPPPITEWSDLWARAVERLRGRPAYRWVEAIEAWGNAPERSMPDGVPAIPFLLVTYHWSIFGPAEEGDLEKHIDANLSAIHALVQRQGAALILMNYLDNQRRFLNDEIVEYARINDIVHVDLPAVHAPMLNGPNRSDYFDPDRSHPNASGYRLVASAALEALVGVLSER